MTYIYRYKNYNGDIYYVGKAVDLPERDKQHSRYDGWCYDWLEVEYITCEDYIASEVEKYFIQLLNPIYNKYRPESTLTQRELNIYLPNQQWKKYYR